MPPLCSSCVAKPLVTGAYLSLQHGNGGEADALENSISLKPNRDSRIQLGGFRITLNGTKPHLARLEYVTA